MRILPYETVQVPKNWSRDPLKLVHYWGREVFEHTDDLEETFDLGRRSQGDTQVPTELERRAQRVAFDDVRFDGQSRAPQLLEHRPRSRMIGAVRCLEEIDGKPARALPNDKRAILTHARKL